MWIEPFAALRGAAVLALLAALPWGAAPAAAATGAKPVQDLTRSADFIFRGTVQKTGAANLSIVEPDAKTAIVRVDETLKSSGTIDDFTGREITVFLSEPLNAGDQRVFFTTVKLLGESLGAQEIGRPSGAAADLAAEVRNAHSANVREGLEARLAAADLVVSGRVLSTRAMNIQPQDGAVTEHDPQWREAVLEVRSVLKGRAVEKTVAFWYPGSLDVMWAQVPKPNAGQEGTWLLHRHTPESGAAVYAVADPKDLMTAAEEKLAATLVKQGVNP